MLDMNNNFGKVFFSAIMVASLTLSITPATAADFPEKAITIIVNWPAGGGQDTSARLIADWASKRSAVPIIVSNVTGAGGANGIRAAAEAVADGYTIGIMGSSFVARGYINKNATPLDDIDPLVFFGPDPGALEVRADTGIKTVQEYIDKLKAEPGSILNGNDAPGGSSHIFAALFENAFDVKMTKVPYQGYSPTVAAIISGEVNSATLPVHQLSDQHKAGDVRILAVAAAERHFLAPDVPTFNEIGLDFVAGDWRALFAPNGLPKEARTYLESLFMDTLSDPEFKMAAQKVGFMVTPMPSAETKAWIVAHDKAVYPILLDAGMVKARKK